MSKSSLYISIFLFQSLLSLDVFPHCIRIVGYYHCINVYIIWRYLVNTIICSISISFQSIISTTGVSKFRDVSYVLGGEVVNNSPLMKFRTERHLFDSHDYVRIIGILMAAIHHQFLTKGIDKLIV